MNTQHEFQHEAFFQDFQYQFSTVEVKDLPDTPSFAFLGRSNSGKSTLLNAITGRKNLAKVSKTPGKTKLINVFQNKSKVTFIDLPGFGYSKASATEHKSMMQILETFLNEAKTVSGLLILCDAQRPFPEEEFNFSMTALQKKMNPAIIRTKSDKLNQSSLAERRKEMENVMTEAGVVFPIFFPSALTGKGLNPVRDWIYQNKAVQKLLST